MSVDVPASADPVEVVSRFAAARVLVIGDFILDSFVEGAVHRISPEAPIPVLHNQTERQTLGGAGNVVANVVALGGTALALGVTGDDAAGRRMLELLGGNAPQMLAEPGRITPHKTRYSAQNQQILRVDNEEIRPLAAETRRRLLVAFDAALGDADIVVLSDYAKGVLLDGVAAQLIGRARTAGKPVIVDPKDRNFGSYAGATIITPNLKELSEAAGHPVTEEGEIVDTARGLLVRHGFAALVVTRSEKGLSVITADSATHIPAAARELFDVSGAGDTVAASLALALATGLPVADAARIANTAAGLAVAKPGTAVVTAGELAETLARGAVTEQTAIVDLAEATGRIEAWKREGLRVGFTNGCFDLLHAGHVTLLQAARARCDRLVVGLNSDASVRRLKGETRPINGLADRALVLAALSAVDLVVGFAEDTPAQLIEALRPDVLVKGSDYTIDEVVGARFVQASGGDVVLVDLVDGKSTTEIIRRMAASRGSVGERPQ